MSDDDVPPEEQPPYHLMPVAAALGCYIVAALVHLLRRLYVRLSSRGAAALEAELAHPWKKLGAQLGSALAAMAAYGRVVSLVEAGLANARVFDPFDVLGVATGANSTVIKRAYRSLSLVHHPDKGGDLQRFQELSLAYKALNDPLARENWEKYGHPDGPVRATFNMALPDWLLHPTGVTAVVLLVLYLGMFVAIILYVVKMVTANDEAAAAAKTGGGGSLSVAGADSQYLQCLLDDASTHEDVLYFIATTPENLHCAKRSIVEAAKQKHEEEEAAKTPTPNDALLDDDGGWDDDAGEKDAATSEQEAAAAQRAAAFGLTQPDKVEYKVEGLHPGVIGQTWVENRLAELGVWPPQMTSFSKNAMVRQIMAAGRGENDDGTEPEVDLLRAPHARRNICYVVARLNAHQLNTSPELVEAGKTQLLDTRYFRENIAFRNRVGLLLEASLRVAIQGQKATLAATIVESVAMFKVGSASATDPAALAWFRGQLEQQYGPGSLPGLKIENATLGAPDGDAVAAGDVCRLSMDAQRTHAAAFTKAKVLMCQKRGIDPATALSSYREGWWVLVRSRETTGPDGEAHEEKLLSAWPVIVQNVASAQAKINVQFEAPKRPGRYALRIQIKSQEFLGCDQEFPMELVVGEAVEVAGDEEEEGTEDVQEEEDDGEDSDSESDDDGVVVEKVGGEGLRKRPTAGKRS